jgi:hypothetical protein
MFCVLERRSSQEPAALMPDIVFLLAVDDPAFLIRRSDFEIAMYSSSAYQAMLTHSIRQCQCRHVVAISRAHPVTCLYRQFWNANSSCSTDREEPLPGRLFVCSFTEGVFKGGFI